MRDFFDRKTFDPVNNAEHKATLSILRTVGRQRMATKAPSTTMRWVLQTKLREGLFLDLGCGDSADCIIAEKLGFSAVGIDLFPPSDVGRISFAVNDVAERIEWPDNSVSVAISQAMVDLIEPVARENFYREVNRVLKPGATFLLLYAMAPIRLGIRTK